MAAALRRRLWQSTMFPNGSMRIVLRRLTSSMLAQRFDLGYCNRTSPIGRMTSLQLFFFALANWTGIFRSYFRPGQLDRDIAVVLLHSRTGQGSSGRIHALANWTGMLQSCLCPGQLDRDLTVVFMPWPTGQGYAGMLQSGFRPGQLDRDTAAGLTHTHGERETFCGDVRSVY